MKQRAQSGRSTRTFCRCPNSLWRFQSACFRNFRAKSREIHHKLRIGARMRALSCCWTNGGHRPQFECMKNGTLNTNKRVCCPLETKQF